MSVRERLKRQLAKKKEDADARESAYESKLSDKYFCSHEGFSLSELNAADESYPSLVEEILSPSDIASIGPSHWSGHRKIAAFSLSRHPKTQLMWQEMVWSCLRDYYVVRENEFLKRLVEKSFQSVKPQMLRRNALELAQISTGDRILMLIFGHLTIWCCLGVANLVCRRWHFVARCVWNRVELLQIDPTAGAVSPTALLKPSEFVYRMPTLTSITLCGGLKIPIDNLAKILDRKVAALAVPLPPIDTLRIYDISFVSSRHNSVDDANELVCKFLRSSILLKELVLVNANVCLLDGAKNVCKKHALDLWWFEFCHTTKGSKLALEVVQFSGEAFQRFSANFDHFCKPLLQCGAKAVIFSGATTSSSAAGLSEFDFSRGLALLMPHLRELSLCNLSFSDSDDLGVASLELLSKAVRRNSNLELFCLTHGEISDMAIYDLQRCDKLQILILLRCKIISKNPDLPLIVGWHPNANLPSSLITDYVTVPLRLRPTYFRVVRIDSFTEFDKEKFVELRKRWWTFRALLKSAELGLPEYYFKSAHFTPEEIFHDANGIFA